MKENWELESVVEEFTQSTAQIRKINPETDQFRDAEARPRGSVVGIPAVCEDGGRDGRDVWLEFSRSGARQGPSD